MEECFFHRKSQNGKAVRNKFKWVVNFPKIVRSSPPRYYWELKRTVFRLIVTCITVYNVNQNEGGGIIYESSKLFVDSMKSFTIL